MCEKARLMEHRVAELQVISDLQQQQLDSLNKQLFELQKDINKLLRTQQVLHPFDVNPRDN